MARKGIGQYARAHLDAQKLVEAYMGLATLYIQREYAMEDDELTLEELTLTRYLDELDNANMNDTRREFDDKLVKMLGPIIEQVMAPPEVQ